MLNHLIASLIVMCSADSTLRPVFPPFAQEDPDWHPAPDGHSMTFVGQGRLRIIAGFSTEQASVEGLDLDLSTDAVALCIRAGREMLRLDLPQGEAAVRVRLPAGHRISDGIEVGGQDIPGARAAWVRILNGIETRATVEFERATFVVIERGGDAESELAERELERPSEPEHPDEAEQNAEGLELERHGERGWVQTFIGDVPVLDLERGWDVPPSKVYEMAARLHDAFECGDCSGSGLFAQTRTTGRTRSAGPFVERERRTVNERCDPCSGTGYITLDSTTRIMDTFVERFCMVERGSDRYERGIDGLWAEKIRAVLEIHPSTVGEINQAWRHDVRDLQTLEIGEPMWFVGRIDFERPVWLTEIENDRIRGAYVGPWPGGVTVLVVDPQIEQSTPGDNGCLIGGIYSGVVQMDGTPVPVLQGGFIVGR